MIVEFSQENRQVGAMDLPSDSTNGYGADLSGCFRFQFAGIDGGDGLQAVLAGQGQTIRLVVPDSGCQGTGLWAFAQNMAELFDEIGIGGPVMGFGAAGQQQASAEEKAELACHDGSLCLLHRCQRARRACPVAVAASMLAMHQTGTVLDEIIRHKQRQELPLLPPLDRAVLQDLPPTRGFRAALKRSSGSPIHVIAESKKGSPSRGVFSSDYDPVRNAYGYVLGGAQAMSVLTDERYFFGSLADLQAVRAAVELPLIRKDFTIDARQVAEARLVGADAILLIVACLEDGLLQDLYGFAREIGLDVLVETHDAAEVVRAVRLGADLVGVNNRDLKTFQVSVETTFAVLPALQGADRVVVSESGIDSREQCLRLEEAGVDAVLVGESLMRAADPAVALKGLRGQLSSELT